MEASLGPSTKGSGFRGEGLGTLSLSHRIEVTDDLGAIVATVLLADAVRVRT